jgi:hypothetical protein
VDACVPNLRVNVGRNLRLLPLFILALAPACKKAHHGTQQDAGAPRPGIALERIEAENNGTKQALYSGSTGSVEGTITIAGDAAPDITPYLDKIPGTCADAQGFYGRLFREGPNRQVADVLVAVTEYHGYVKPKSDHVQVLARGCSWDRRTIALTFGQRIEVRSGDSQAYVPQLLGAPSGALLVAVPKGDAVPVLPMEPGHYVLIDSMRLYSKADVFVLRYPTTDVTGPDGHFRIDGVPVGPAKLSAMLPSTGSTGAKPVTIESNRTAHVDLVLTFDKSTFKPRGAAAPSGSSSGAPQTAP